MKFGIIQKIKEKVMRNRHEVSDDVQNDGETGRGMVEMLGVLAIIGVLTIGSIFGYNYGMKMYRVNEMIETLNRQAVLASAAKAVGVDLPEDEWDTTAAGFEIEYSPTYEEDGEVYDNFFTITIKNVPNDLLEMLIKKEGGKAYQILINGIPVDDYDFKNYRRIEHSFLNEISLVKHAWAGLGNIVSFIFESDDNLFEKPKVEGTFCKDGRLWVRYVPSSSGITVEHSIDNCDLHGAHCTESGGPHCECDNPPGFCEEGSKTCVGSSKEVCRMKDGCSYTQTTFCPAGCCDGECCSLGSPGGCCGDGSCKPAPPGCCPEEMVDGCCPDDDNCCPSSCECGCE